MLVGLLQEHGTHVAQPLSQHLMCQSFVENVANEGLGDKVQVLQTGCIGICRYEPVAEVYEAGKEKVTYVKLDAEKAKRIVEEHLKGGKVVAEYTIANYEK